MAEITATICSWSRTSASQLHTWLKPCG